MFEGFEVRIKYHNLLFKCNSLKLKQVITKKACTNIKNMLVSLNQFIKGLKSELNHHTLVLVNFKQDLNHFKSSCSFVIKIFNKVFCINKKIISILQ